MPVPSSVVGASTEPVVHEVDARWTMAFAGGIGDLSPRYLDTTAVGGVVAHPVFPVCLEWPAVRAARRLVPEDVLPGDEAARGVHAAHHLSLDRLVRPGDRLTTVGTVVGVQRRSPGAFQTLRLTTTDATGATVCTTHMGSLFLGVDVDGEDRPAPALSPATAPVTAGEQADDVATRLVSGEAALVYTECARIWNPIHTDPAVARAAGLPAPILHGTATLAMAVSEIVARAAAGDPERVRMMTCRFGAMVTMPSSVDIAIRRYRDESSGAMTIGFDVRNAAGERAIRDGVVTLA